MSVVRTVLSTAINYVNFINGVPWSIFGLNEKSSITDVQNAVIDAIQRRYIDAALTQMKKTPAALEDLTFLYRAIGESIAVQALPVLNYLEENYAEVIDWGTTPREVNRRSFLQLAIETRNDALVDFFLEKCTPYCKNEQRGCDIPWESALHTASRIGYEYAACKIISKSPGVLSEEDVKGRLPLHVSVYSKDPIFVSSLIEAYENSEVLKAQDLDGNMPHHLAALERDIPLLNVFLEKDPSLLEEPGQNKMTVLLMAVDKSNIELFKYLALKYNADFQKRDEQNRSILHIAA